MYTYVFVMDAYRILRTRRRSRQANVQATFPTCARRFGKSCRCHYRSWSYEYSLNCVIDPLQPGDQTCHICYILKVAPQVTRSISEAIRLIVWRHPGIHIFHHIPHSWGLAYSTFWHPYIPHSWGLSTSCPLCFWSYSSRCFSAPWRSSTAVTASPYSWDCSTLFQPPCACAIRRAWWLAVLLPPPYSGSYSNTRW